jgi:hypothetical protein
MHFSNPIPQDLLQSRVRAKEYGDTILKGGVSYFQDSKNDHTDPVSRGASSLASSAMDFGQSSRGASTWDEIDSVKGLVQ